MNGDFQPGVMVKAIDNVRLVSFMGGFPRKIFELEPGDFLMITAIQKIESVSGVYRVRFLTDRGDLYERLVAEHKFGDWFEVI